MWLPPLPEWAAGTPVRGRNFAFSNAVLEGRICVNCQYLQHPWFHPGTGNQYYDYDYHPEEVGTEWPPDMPPPEYGQSQPEYPGYNQPPSDTYSGYPGHSYDPPGDDTGGYTGYNP